jgi:hypothetical protein
VVRFIADLVPGLIWRKGLYADAVVSSDYIMEERRTDVIRALIAACSECLYINYENSYNYTPICSWVLTISTTRHVKTAFFTLLNTTLTYTPESFVVDLM